MLNLVYIDVRISSQSLLLSLLSLSLVTAVIKKKLNSRDQTPNPGKRKYVPILITLYIVSLTLLSFSSKPESVFEKRLSLELVGNFQLFYHRDFGTFLVFWGFFCFLFFYHKQKIFKNVFLTSK